MAILEIKDIKSAPLKQLADDIDKSKVSARDYKIDNKEFGIFKQRAKIELLDKHIISNDDYTAIFGLEKTITQEVNADSLAYVEALKNIEENDSIAEAKSKEAQIKNAKISKLKEDIVRMKNELYKGKFDNGDLDSYTDGKMAVGLAAGNITGIFVGAITGALTGGWALSVAGAAILGASAGCILLAGAGALVAYAYCKYNEKSNQNYIKQCEQQNPQLYKAIQYAEKELAKLEAGK